MSLTTETAISYLEALAREHSKATECVAALRCYHALSHLKIRRSALFNAMANAASERIIMTLGRVLDEDRKTITAISFCRCIEQNPCACGWAFSDAGRETYPDPVAEVRRLTKQWQYHWLAHPLRQRIKHSRDKSIAHLDKNFWLTAETLGEIRITEVESLLTDLMQMVNDFRELTDNCQVGDLVFPMTSIEGALSIAYYEAGMYGLSKGFIDEDRFAERVDQIREAIDRDE